jgi:hypothetical protein
VVQQWFTLDPASAVAAPADARQPDETVAPLAARGGEQLARRSAERVLSALRAEQAEG